MGGNVGFCDFDRKLLQVSNDVDVDVRNSTLMHEIMEAINYHLEIELTERQIKQLEVGLHQVLNEGGVNLNPLIEERKELYGRYPGKPGGVVLLQAKDST